MASAIGASEALSLIGRISTYNRSELQLKSPGAPRVGRRDRMGAWESGFGA